MSSHFLFVCLQGYLLIWLRPLTLNFDITCFIPKLRIFIVDPTQPYSWKKMLSKPAYRACISQAFVLYCFISFRRSALSYSNRIAKPIISKSILSTITLCGELTYLAAIRISSTFCVPNYGLLNLTINWFSLQMARMVPLCKWPQTGCKAITYFPTPTSGYLPL